VEAGNQRRARFVEACGAGTQGCKNAGTEEGGWEPLIRMPTEKAGDAAAACCSAG